MGAAEPTLSFTVPSVHDGTPLDCRVYHPPSGEKDNGKAKVLPRWDTAAIVAHPYAPLGGCYDDFVVLDVVRALLKEGVIVGTFNFRGAGGSKGRTTWTGKGEISDYESFIAFIVTYMDAVKGAISSSSSDIIAEESASADEVSRKQSSANETKRGIRLILAGYSYGSLVVTRLPPIKAIMDSICSANENGHADELFSLARSLAMATAAELQREHRVSRGNRVKIGHSDTSPPSRDGKRSMEVLHDLPHAWRRRHRESKTSPSNTRTSSISSLDFPDVSAFYLLVSPILPPLSNFVMLPLGSRQANADESGWTERPTFAVFGDQDGFTSIKKLTPWAQKLSTDETKGEFTFAAVAGAGHFWTEEGVSSKMKSAIRQWIKVQLSSSGAG